MRGLHIIAELHGCACTASLLREAGQLRDLCLAVCATAGLTVVAEAFHEFPHGGATGALVLAESHLAVHTWPELAGATLDLYVCNFSRDNRAAAEAAFVALQTAFGPKHTLRRDIERGDLAAP